jgi:hypothetical protein
MNKLLLYTIPAFIIINDVGHRTVFVAVVAQAKRTLQP